MLVTITIYETWHIHKQLNTVGLQTSLL